VKQTARILPSRLKRTGTFSGRLCRNSVGTGAKTPLRCGVFSTPHRRKESRVANHYWPALYFIDAAGRVRDHHSGEGNETVPFAYAECRSVTLSFDDVEVLTSALLVAGGLSEGYPRE